MNATADPAALDALTLRLEQCYSGAVYDVMRDMGLPPQVLPRTIRPIAKGMRAAGPVFTFRGRPDRTASAHETLLAWTDFLGRARPGHVIMCQPQDDFRALIGELSAETLKFRGIRGYIVDGGSRDNEFIERIGFPVFCRYRTPIDIVASWLPEAYDEPVSIGQVTVSAGDWVLADDDGVVIVPRDQFEEVLERVEEVMQTENKVRTAILAGTDPKEAYLEWGKF